MRGDYFFPFACGLGLGPCLDPFDANAGIALRVSTAGAIYAAFLMNDLLDWLLLESLIFRHL